VAGAWLEWVCYQFL